MATTAETLLELLQKGDIDAFNEARRDVGTVELFAADLAGAKLSGADLSGFKLEKADLSGADLSDTILARTNLSGADLSETDLTGAMAIQLRLRDAWVEDTKFDEADLTQCDLSDTEFHNCTFKETILTKAKLKRSNFVGCSFETAEASEARFSGATTERCSFEGAELREASFKGAKLPGADFTRASLSLAKLREADLTGAKLHGTTARSADFSSAVLAQASVIGADFRRADLSGADLTDVELDEATLDEAEVPAEYINQAWMHVPDLGPPLLQDASWACNGTHVAAVWQDTDEDARPWFRVAVSPVSGPGFHRAPVVPVPGDLVLATAVAATATGFSVIALVERPAGVATWIFPVDCEGVLQPAVRADLPYRPMVKPLLQAHGGSLDIYGIGGQPPILAVMRLAADGTLDVAHHASARTARGFASDHHPVVLTKGGTLDLVVPGKTSRPVSAPGDFPGRSCGVVPVDPSDPGRGVVAAWVPSSGRGLKITLVAPGTQPDPDLLLRKVTVGSVDAAISGNGAWAVFTRPAIEEPTRLEAWAVQLPMGKPVQLDVPAELEGRSVRTVSLVPTPAPHAGVAIVSWDDGTSTVVVLSSKGGRAVWSA